MVYHQPVETVPFGKRLQKTMENHHVVYSWVNQLFRLGHVQCRKLFVYQRVIQDWAP